ncbi:hypothetical protein [Sphingomonas hylomeconis]|uniref:Uncharacterized protein n=1 Tax=Sphingomonas hylomeconis TaxID=1395958 RepID=A0ABV7SRQ3_9SPHN|nr:hypothetical protein [Sphingomonas hylomeconis]
MSALLMLIAQAAAAPATPANPPAPWTVRTANVGGVASTSTSTIARDGSSRLVVKCDRATEALVSVQFFAKQPLQMAGDDGSFASKPVALRFDNGAANGYDWQLRSYAAYTSNDAVVTSLTLQLAKAKQIKVETTSASNFRFEAVFDGPPTDAPIRQVLQACGYVLGQVPVFAQPAPAK